MAISPKSPSPDHPESALSLPPEGTVERREIGNRVRQVAQRVFERRQVLSETAALGLGAEEESDGEESAGYRFIILPGANYPKISERVEKPPLKPHELEMYEKSAEFYFAQGRRLEPDIQLQRETLKQLESQHKEWTERKEKELTAKRYFPARACEREIKRCERAIQSTTLALNRLLLDSFESDQHGWEDRITFLEGKVAHAKKALEELPTAGGRDPKGLEKARSHNQATFTRYQQELRSCREKLAFCQASLKELRPSIEALSFEVERYF